MITLLPSFFFFNDTATTEIYTLPLHDALPIFDRGLVDDLRFGERRVREVAGVLVGVPADSARGAECRQLYLADRSEEHTSELQSRQYLVCRLLLEKKKTNITSSASTKSTSMRLFIVLFTQ